VLFFLVCFVACAPDGGPEQPPSAIDSQVQDEGEVLEKGVRMIPIDTPNGPFEVWTKKFGDSRTLCAAAVRCTVPA
jgi:hypothetical protein